MSRISKWKLEKTKVKVVFRLQFHATHIPQTGWDKLFISFIPTDTGKATAKTTKANVRNGTCKWADPIYETTRLLQDSKSKRYDEKLYKIVVAMGSSRASTLGEATINLADYVDALKPSAVSLPLHGCNFGTILHITVQLLTSKTGFREFEQQRELRETGLQSGVDSHGRTAAGKMPYSDEASARIKLKAEANELSSLEEEANVNEEYADSATGFDGSSNTSGSLYAEKHETSSAHEIDSLKSTTSGDLHVLPHYQSPHTTKRDPSDHPTTAQGSTGSAHGWGSDNSVDNEFAMACEENNRLRGSLELAESSFFNLKLEVSSLQSLADELGTETQKFSHLLAAEISSSEELAKEVSIMKTECVKYKDDIVKLKDLKLSPQISIAETSGDQVDHLVRNVQLQFLKGINVVEGKIRELLNKTYVVPRDGDTKFIYLELEALLNFLLDFKLGNGDVMPLLRVQSERADVKEIRERSTFTDQQLISENGLGLDLCPPDTVLRNFTLTPPISEIVNPVGTIDALKGQIFDLVRELDEAKIEKEALTRKMDQMECYYETFIQELEENQKRMLGELQLLRNEHSSCLYTLSASKAEMESLRQDMNQQMLRFVDERRDLEALNKELERRATTSEAALRRARLNYSIAVDKLQKDLELLSSQVMSMFETNENIIKQALPSQPHSQGDQKLPDNDDVIKLSRSQNQNSDSRKRSMGGDVLLEDLKKSFSMQEELYQNVEQELIEMYSINLNLDIYSKALQQSLLEASGDFRMMKVKMDELVEELKLSAASQNQLVVRLQQATDEIHALNEYKSTSVSQFSDMSLQNQHLEEKLASLSEENYLLSQKLEDVESAIMEYKSYQSKYAACLAENAELSLKLKHEAFENEKLSDEMSFLKEKLTILKGELDEVISSKENLKENISFVRDKLGNMLASYNRQFRFLANSLSLDLDHLDIKDAVLQLEEIHHNACVTNCQLMEENQNLKKEKAIADVSLSSVRSEVLTMKQKFKSSVQELVTKLDVSNAFVDKLQAELESVANKLYRSSEIEDKYAQESGVLLADLVCLEDQIQELTCKNGHLAREFSGLDALAEELGRSKLTIAELVHDKQELVVCLQDKSEESSKLSLEISCLKDDLKILHDQLHEEKAYKDELEGKVRDLTSQLNEDRDKLHDFEVQKAELTHVKELVSALELEKSRLVGEILGLDALAEELGRSKLTINQLMHDKEELTVCLRDKSEESIELSHEISSLKDDLKSLHNELHEKKAYKDELEGKVRDLTSQLNEDRDKLLDFEVQKSEFMRLKELVSDLELEKSKLARELLGLDSLAEELGRSKLTITELMHDKQELTVCLQDKSEESIKLSHEISSLKDDLKSLHDELHEEKSYKDELQGKIRDLTSQLNEDRDKLFDFKEQKAELTRVRELVSDLEMEKSRVARLLDQQSVSIEERKKNSSYRDSLESQLLELHEYSLAVDVKLVYVANQYEYLLQELQQKLVSSEGCLGRLQKRYRDAEFKWREEKAHLLTSLESLRSDLEASGVQNKLLLDSNNEIRYELEECKEKLKVMETRISSDNIPQDPEVERLKKLIIDAEEEISSLTVSKEELEVLVILLKEKVKQSASITLLEEYENELTMLRSQCDELSHKLSEQVLKTEEFKNLSTHLKELKDKAEAECFIAREKRETEVPSFTVQDSLRIAFIKEQYESKIQELKQQLSISKKHGEEMLLKLQDAIDEIENRKKSEAMNLKRNEELLVRLSALEEELQLTVAEKREKSKAYDRTKAELECALLSLECCKEEKEKLGASLLEFESEKSQLAMELTAVKGQLENLKSSRSFEKDECGSVTEVEHAINGSTGNSSPIFLEQSELPYSVKRGRENFILFRDGENVDSTEVVQDTATEEFHRGNGENLEVNIESLGAQQLRSSIEHLHEELEKMKHENTIFDINHDVDPGFEVPEREIMQLHKANEELGSMFPSFNEISSGGNALERVLALEIELAEALKAKNKPNLQFQSSFLKQHSDEEAIFKSFRDINDLIKETLELKGKHAAMESELREMHNRYSRLSLQFAEVEGERQKLKMTLKNVRASKKLVSLN